MAYPTDDPTVEAILANIRTTLLSIQGAPTYRTTVAGAEHVALNAVDIKSHPFVAIGPPEFTFSDGQYRLIATGMTLTLLAVVHTQTETTKALRNIMHDVSLAMRADHTRGGYAKDTHVTAAIPDVPDPDHPLAAVELTLSVDYRHLTTDPSTPL